MGFKENLKEIMDYKDLTIKELSFMTGIPKGSLSNYLKESSSIPAADIAVKIAAALNVSVETLVTGTYTQNSSKNYDIKVLSIAEKINKLSITKQTLVDNLISDLEKV